VPPVPAAPPAPPVPPAIYEDDGHDRRITGGNLRIDKGENVHDVQVLGGNVDVWGTVTGDLAVVGGNVTVHDGARVRGDAATVGGTLTLEAGSSVDGDVGVLGGSLRRDPGARIGGEVHEGVGATRERHHGRRVHVTVSQGGADAKPAKVDAVAAPDPAREHRSSALSRVANKVAGAINFGALLFVFGAVLLALAPDRMEKLKVQIAARPMRSFATGVVSVIAGIVLFIAACLTVIGIPFAIIGLLAAIVGTLAGMISVLETIGGALLAHRTKNPYVHLAFGALIFLVASAVPFIGPLVKLSAVLIALGSVVATRAAGLAVRRPPSVGSPYRDAEVT
jgi:hypothetical protein